MVADSSDHFDGYEQDFYALKAGFENTLASVSSAPTTGKPTLSSMWSPLTHS